MLDNATQLCMDELHSRAYSHLLEQGLVHFWDTKMFTIFNAWLSMINKNLNFYGYRTYY
jgi:hypothetical protein